MTDYGIHAIREIPAIVAERAYTNVTVMEDGCWSSNYHRLSNGYAQLTRRDPETREDHAYLAHRAAYTYVHGPIPADMMIDHACFNRGCVNPDHLRAITHMQNSQRRQTVGYDFPLDECAYGHPHATYLHEFKNKQGQIRHRCSECYRIKSNGANARRRALTRLRTTYGLTLTDQQAEMVLEFYPISSTEEA